MIDLNDMLAAQLKENNAKFPDINKGILVTMVCFMLTFSPFCYDSEYCLEVCCVIMHGYAFFSQN